MAFDVKRWLSDEMGFSETEATDYASKIAPERVAKIEASHVKQTALLAREGDISKTQQDLIDANNRLNAEMAEWAALTAKEKSQSGELQTALEASRVRAVQLEQRLTNLATQHGVDPKSLLEGTTEIPKREEPKVAPVDPTRFVPAENFQAVSSFNLDLAGALPYIQAQHLALTGEQLDTREITKEIRARAGKRDAVVDPVAVWEEKYSIPEKRQAKETAARAEELRQAELRGEERARTNQALPASHVAGRHAPVFGPRTADGVVQNRTSVLNRPQPGSTLQNAVSAFRTGKYRSGAAK